MPKRPICAEDLLRMVFVGDAQISPDGDRVLFSHKTINDRNKYVAQLVTVDLEGRLTQWTQGETSAGAGRWAPDGSAISFISDRKPNGSQIHLLPTKGGEGRPLTRLPEGDFGEYRWSPDARHIAFTFREEAEELKKSSQAAREEKGLSKPPLVTEDAQYREDGDGFFGERRYALYVVEVATGDLVPIGGTDRDGNALPYRGAPDGRYSFDWSPNGRELAVAHTFTSRPHFDLANDQIWRLSLEGQAWKLEGLPKGTKGSLRWSPDGRWLAFAGNTSGEATWGAVNTRAYRVSAEGGETLGLLDAEDADIAVATLGDTSEASDSAFLAWAPDNSGLFVQVGTRGEAQLGFVPFEGGIRILTEGHHVLSIGSLSPNGQKVAAIQVTSTHLPEVAIIEPELGTGQMVAKLLTNLNGAFHDEIRVVEPEAIEFTSPDGTMVNGWVMKPLDYLPPRRYPALLSIHGGPHTQYGWTFFHEFQLMAAQGYVVVYTNPRGSKGYGEAHCTAIAHDWGNKDWLDIQGATSWMQSQAFISPGQMAVMGGSYGGYMTNWVIGHTSSFRCAITDRCVSNFVSMSGNCDFTFNQGSYFGESFYGNLEAISALWRQSPIAYFKNVRTPTLIIHSEGDLRCNVEQGEQVFAALQEQGIESRFVRYPSTSSHGMSRNGPPDLRLHRLGEMVNWLDRFLK